MDDDVFQKIEAYESGEMNSEERLQFETQLSVNNRLSTRVCLYKNLEQTLKLSQTNKDDQTRLQQTLTAVHKEYLNNSGKVVSFYRIRKWYIAAAALFIIAISVFLLQKSNLLRSEKMYARYAVFPVLSGTRGNNDTVVSNAIKLYNSNMFAKAEPFLEKALASDSSDVEMQLALYICELQTGDFEKALQGFGKIASTENVFTYQAKWYIALTCLKNGDIEKCKNILAQIPPSADTFAKANQLLQELK